jgi:phage terminase large subunit-like protein
MEFMSYEQDVDKFGGTSRHFIWFDEEPPQDIFEECLTRLIDTDGDWFITMTPLQEMSWTYNTLYLPGLNKKIDIDIIAADTYENPHIKQEAFERLTLTMSDESKATRRTGTYISHTGLIYGESFKREKNVCPDLVQSDRFQILKDDWSHFQMMDHGYTNYTAILFAAYNEDGKIIIYDEIYEHKKIVRDLAQLWRERREALGISTKYSVGDPAIRSKDPIKGSSVQSEYGENGIYIALGNNDVQSGITLVQRMFREQQLIITQRCEKLLDELSQYRWDRHLTKARDRKNTKETPVKKNDHAMDALRYGIMSRPRRFNDIPTREVPVGMHVVRAATDYDWELVNQTDQHIDEFLGSEV